MFMRPRPSSRICQRRSRRSSPARSSRTPATAVGLRSQVMAAGIASLRARRPRASDGHGRSSSHRPSRGDDPDRTPTEPRWRSSTASVRARSLWSRPGRDARTAYWGELFSASAKGHGAVGAVCDGPVRDVAKIRALGFDVFAPVSRARSTSADACGSWRRPSPSAVAACWSRPATWSSPTTTGSSSCPSGRERRSCACAVERATAERSVLEELLGGASLREVWDRWHVL